MTNTEDIYGGPVTLASQNPEALQIAGTLKPRALMVIEILESAQCRMLNAITIAKRMGERASVTTDLLIEMRRLGLVARATTLPEPWSACTWSLEIHTAQRKRARTAKVQP